MPVPLILGSMNPRSALHRALVVNPGSELPLDRERVYARDLEVPSGGGVGTARAIAKAYGEFAAGGAHLGLRAETLAELAAPPVAPRRGPIDECLKGAVAFSLGFMEPTQAWPFGHPGAYGAPGAGGSLGYADPQTGIGYGYVTTHVASARWKMVIVGRSYSRRGRMSGSPVGIEEVALRPKLLLDGQIGLVEARRLASTLSN